MHSTSGHCQSLVACAQPHAGVPRTAPRLGRLGLAAALLLGVGLSAPAGPLEDAKALLKAKKYGEVDAALGKQLDAEKPSQDVLRVSLDAALASGTVLTAQKRITALLRINQAPELLFLGGQIAERAGNDNLAVARYLTFARQTAAKSAELKTALRILIRRNTYPDEYKKYLALFGADGFAWENGRALLSRLVQTGETEKAIDIAATLIRSFKHPAQIGAIHGYLRWVSDRNELGASDAEKYYAPLTAAILGKPDSLGNVEHFFGNACRVMTPEQQVATAFAIQATERGPLSGGLLNRFNAMRSLPSDEAKLAAGRKFLALEPIYRDAPNPQLYDYYLSVIGDSPQVFAIQGKALITPDAIQKRFDVLKGKFAGNAAALLPNLGRVYRNYLGSQPELAIAFLKKHIAMLDAGHFATLLEVVKGEGFEALLATVCKGRSAYEVIQMRSRTLKWRAAAKQKDPLLATAREYVSAFPGNFDWSSIYHYVLVSDVLDMDTRINLLQELRGKGGSSAPLREIIRHLLKIKDSKNKRPWAENPRFQAFKKEFDAKKAGSDIVMATHVTLCNTPTGQGRYMPEVTQRVTELLAAHKGTIPGGWEKTANARDVALVGTFHQHGSIVWNNRKGVVEWAEMWAPRLGIGSAWEPLVRRVAEHSMRSTLYTVAPHYVAAVKGADKGDPAVWYRLKSALNPRTDPKSLFKTHYAKMGGEAALAYLSGQDDAMEPQTVMDEMGKIVAQAGFKFTDRALANSLIHWAYHKAGPKSKPSLNFIQALWTFYLAEEQRTKRYNVMTEGYAAGLLAKAGYEKEAAQHLAAYLKAIGTRAPWDQIQAVASVYTLLPAEAEKKAEPGKRTHTLLKRVKPLYEQVKPEDWPLCITYDQLLGDTAGIVSGWPDGPDKNDALALLRRQVDMVMNGARHSGQGSSLFPLIEHRLGEVLAAKDWAAVSRLTRYYARVLRWGGDWNKNYQERIFPLVEKLQAEGAHEIAYVFIDAIERYNRPAGNVAKQIALLKSKVARSIPKLLPVDKGHPTYDLHLAAQALDFGSEARAWELTAPKLKLLPTTWTTLDPRFVAWTLEQMRKQKLLKEALELAFTVLLREFDLDPEVAARVSLCKGDIYSDMQNYQAARIEYEGLKNNRRYSRTRAGSRARYRLIRLLILTRDYAAAESLLERLVDSDSLDTQAEAYYLYSRIAFDQADYEQAKDHLREVFKRKHDHVEARLLEGELKLLVPRGLASTEVLVGNPKLRTTAIPGRPLTLKLQDANLSIARGGAAIPVVVTTSKGGDVEHVKLLPSSSDKFLFTGTIATALGKVEKDNVQLELRGDDVVSYVIDPAFQKANDLSYPPKMLDVKFDARLVASAGEILSEEEAEKRELERRLRAARGEMDSRRLAGRTGRTVRPGSPVYVQVTDLDCDLSDQPDRVPVDITTSSGDLLKAYPLVETGPHTGAFRAAVPSGIPLPKASASDTQEGKDPSVVINSTRAGLWTSLADGQKPKWIEVDTMTSQLVKSVTITMPEPKKIRQVALMGSLGDDPRLVAVHPKGARGGGQGLYGQYFGDTALRRRRFTRVDPSINFDFSKKPPRRGMNGANVSVRWTGYVVPRVTETHTFYTVSDDGVRLWIDGKRIINNWGTHGATENNGRAKLTAGKKTPIKLEYFQGTGDAAIKLMWSSAKEKKQLIPTSQLLPGDDVAEVKPLGEITPTDTGFTATLTTPTRLRRLQWIFDDFEGESIAAKEIAVTAAAEPGKPDAKDRLVVPVKQDFTTGTTNTTLEIAPGDRIDIVYADERRTRDDTPTLNAILDSSYYNAETLLANEVIEDRDDRRWIRYEPARRCRPGDQLMIVVTDYDEDLTDKRDTIPVRVETLGGERLEIKALETWINDATDERHRHSGVFLAVLRIGDATGKDTIKVGSGDTVIVSYLDKENTDPGVPVDRVYKLDEAGRGKPELLVYRTTVDLVEDKSADAKARLRRMKLRGRSTEDMVIYREDITARHPDWKPQDEEAPAEAQPKPEPKPAEAKPADAPPIAVSVRSPLLLEVRYPRMALNSGSVFHISAVAESELKAAKKANRKPNILKVPVYVKDIATVARDKGYPITLEAEEKWDEEDMLEEGRFGGVIRLQIGSPGDTVDDLVLAGAKEFQKEERRAQNDYAYRVATLLVAGSDVVHLEVKDAETGEASVTKVRLLSNARLELLDMTYTARKESVHLGERFYVRVTDPDCDATDAQDKMTVALAAASGDKLTLELTETLPHSGVFTGSLKPDFLGGPPMERPEPPAAEGADAPAKAAAPAKAPAKGAAPAAPQVPKPKLDDAVLSVRFGDQVTFTYHDATSLTELGEGKPRDVVVTGKVHYGSDCELATFTKRFKDPEMAVKTRFLMAEALFEMAKEHRKLKQEEIAADEIGRGKRILEEAMRDYPHTSLAAQGEFLLANLAQELGRYQEAIGRYSNIISNWPDSEYAPRSQFKKAICLEKLGNYDQACEEYVKVTYIYPDSSLVADATVRLGNYYYKQKAFKVAGKVFFKFQQRNPTHRLACKALFLSAQCYMKMEDYKESVSLLSLLIDEYTDEKAVRSEAMYWLGDSYFKARNYEKAYQTFKKLTWDYPETKWAKIARGRLTEDVLARFEEEGL